MRITSLTAALDGDLSANVTLAGGIQNMTLSGTGLSATGNNLDDVITAGGANDTLIASSANDTLYGSGTTTFEVASPGTTVTINNALNTDILIFDDGATESTMLGTSQYNSASSTYTTIVADVAGSTVNAVGNSALGQLNAGGSTFTLSQLPTSLIENNILYSVASATASGDRISRSPPR